ncbi:hypothetical protein N0V95_002233 [Ascochyta clinopodiicola]|nr:hypothetical protein N0V95_002233 [Ascochyta clinopodiicola]
MSVFHGKKVTLPESPYLVANESYFFIKDFRKVPTFAVRPFVAGYPHMVSYIEVPLRSLSGYILGSYCVVDDKERDFLHPDALRKIQDATTAISQYLDLKRTERGRMRSERVMDGLCQFIGSHKSRLLDNTQTTSPFVLEIFKDASRPGQESNSIENTEPARVPDYPLDPNVNPEVMPKNASTVTRDKPEPTVVSPQKDDSSKETEPSLSARIDVLLSRAADLIGHAMNLDALVFFDAVETGTLHKESRPSSDFTDKAFPPPNDRKTSPPAQPLSEYPGNVLAASEMSRRPSQSLIRRLTAAYPLGHIFTIDEYGILEEGVQKAKPRLGAGDTSNIHDDCEELLNCIPRARYAIFLPLWHYQRESSYLNCLAWVSDPGKTLEANDINSLTAFGNSLMAEIFRLEAATSTQQKSDFVSSVSHELRSPLHGILATVELMQEQSLDPRLLSMTQMVESCSYTLLDTFDHLLEFSKINSSWKGKEFATPSKSDVVSAPAQKLAVDLSFAVEEVLQAVSLGHSSVLHMEFALKKEHQDPLTSGVEQLPLPLLVTTHIDHNYTWTSRMDSGIWKRILLNIFSNAFRFTVSGHIDVTLGMIESTDVDPQCISLTVADSGVGMSREFLKYHLFTPFMQENNLVSGTGLGLHIVKHLVESVHGNISVESRQHEGTRITINIPFDGEPEKSGQTDGVGSFAPYERTSNLTISLINMASQKTPNSQTAPYIATAPKLLQRCLRNICETSLANTSTKNDSSPTLAQQQSRPSQPPSTPASNPPLIPPTYRFKRLLLVDDNPINLKLLAAFAQRTGLSYATAYDGAEAVRLYKKAATEGETSFDCIFMDISMPTMDGFQATSAIRHFEDQQRKARDEWGESRAGNGDEGLQKSDEGWNENKACENMTPEKKPVNDISHLIFAFAFTAPAEFKITNMPDVRSELFEQVTSLKNRNPDLVIQIASGGWTHNDPGK